MAPRVRSRRGPKARPVGIGAVSIRGYKSLYDRCELEIRPLTLLAGANSSGKSSALQPLLLLKQTLDASYDPGPLLLDGPNVQLTSPDQILCRRAGKADERSFSVGLQLEEGPYLEISFACAAKDTVCIEQMVFRRGADSVTLREGMPDEQIRSALEQTLAYASSSSTWLNAFADWFGRSIDGKNQKRAQWTVRRARCFLGIGTGSDLVPESFDGVPLLSPGTLFGPLVRALIHVPALRGNPVRTYKTTGVGPSFPGTFQNYVASVVSHWQSNRPSEIKKVGNALAALGLTWKVEAKPLDATQVELRVGRLPHAVRGGARDLVSIADVGFGVSQVLPVVVALLAAKPGQLVYIEQPELHLHPRAQTALAELLADAARRGVRVVAETHSRLLLLGVQTLVGEGDLSPDLVKLHWFERGTDGSTKVNSADLDDQGAFGDWPEDFDDVALQAQRRYLDAGE